MTDLVDLSSASCPARSGTSSRTLSGTLAVACLCVAELTRR